MTQLNPKHHRIFDELRASILKGAFPPGTRLPSDNDLGARYKVSRPTVAHALHDLAALGLVERRVGAGTFVRAGEAHVGTFALLIPGLGTTEIFEPICGEIAAELQRHQHTLVWGASAPPEGAGDVCAQSERLCQEYVERKVAGVFFAPIELAPGHEETNRRIVDLLARAGIPVVLLDRDVVPFPRRSDHDVVAVDHRRAGYLVANHLLQLGHRRIDFVARPLSAPSVQQRIAGYQMALLAHGISPRQSWIHLGDPTERSFVEGRLGAPVSAVICANDVTAALLMQTLEAAGRRVPKEVAIVGFDDVRYARLLGVPLTTVTQPCAELGRTAARVMLERTLHAKERTPMVGREILLPADLVVRQSCGTRSRG